MTWKPYSARQGSEPADAYRALHEGVPEWAVSSIRAWVIAAKGALIDTRQYRSEREVVGAIERALRTRFETGNDWRTDMGRASVDHIMRLLQTDAQFTLDLVDFLLSKVGRVAPTRLADTLEGHLREAGMAVRVATDRDGLERRVDETVVARADEVIASAGRAGEHLRRAWRALYGRQPSASEGYREAVRAVEAAGIPIIEPGNDRATLGTMIATVRQHPVCWTIDLAPHGMQPVDLLLPMMTGLWKAQLDRHGTPDVDVPIEVSLEEAETALHLAVTLVHWFSAGRVRRAP